MKTDLLADEANGKQDITAEKEIRIHCKQTKMDVLTILITKAVLVLVEKG